MKKRLKKVLNTERFRFIILFYSDENSRDNCKKYICENFEHSKNITLDLEKSSYQKVAPILFDNEKSFIFIDDFFEVLNNPDLYNGFNQRRDKIASHSINLICFVNLEFEKRFYEESLSRLSDLMEFKNDCFTIVDIQ